MLTLAFDVGCEPLLQVKQTNHMTSLSGGQSHTKGKLGVSGRENSGSVVKV